MPVTMKETLGRSDGKMTKCVRSRWKKQIIKHQLFKSWKIQHSNTTLVVQTVEIPHLDSLETYVAILRSMDHTSSMMKLKV